MLPERVFTEGIRVIRLKTPKTPEEIAKMESVVEEVFKKGERQLREKMERLHREHPVNTGKSIDIGGLVG